MTTLNPCAGRAPDENPLQELMEPCVIERVFFADSSLEPPPLAYVTPFPRMAVPISGEYLVETAKGGEIKEICCRTGEAVFVGRHCWDKPRWTTPVKVLTLLFGKKQIGFSLVTHDGSTNDPIGAIKSSISTSRVGLAPSMLDALISLNDPEARRRVGHLVAGALLHACALALTKPEATLPHRATYTYDAICLFVQENYQQSLTREMIGEHFNIHPCHVSRLFRDEGHIRFTDYINLVRIERAKYLLKNYDMPLKKIATSCGFADAAYFCRVFRTLTRITPTDYRLRGL